MAKLSKFTNKKGYSGTIKSAMVILTLAFVLVSVSYIIPVLAEHTATVTITPDTANCDVLGNTFTVNVKNDVGSADDLIQVEIYKALTGISDFSCGNPPTGWDVFSYTDRCIYVTELGGVYKIEPGEDLDFTFDAKMSSDTCQSLFIAVTIDDAYPTGDRDTHNLYVDIDCTDPVIEKSITSGTYNGVCPPDTQQVGEECWMSCGTIHVTASDDTDECDLGITYCDWDFTVDGVPYDSGHEENGDILEWDIIFDEDSVHVLTITCYDEAGNDNTDVETFIVDCEPPETTKTFDGPQKLGDVEWIDGITKIVLDATDSIGPHDSGVKKIKWRNTIVDNAFCRDQGLCQEAQGSGDIIYDYNPGEGDYSVEILKGEESCHLLEFWAKDNLYNEEEVNKNCFFVDKTPPLLEKDNGDAIPDSGEPMFMTNDNPDGVFHWITSGMPITFTCDDTWDGNTELSPHPSEDEELCFKVSYDYPEWEYITGDYCDEPLNDEGYCCVPVDGEKEFEFYFNSDEETMHNLEYYCKDAVDKKTDVHIQYYKVDDTAPYLIDKWIDGPYHAVSGVCPPTSESDVCHLDGDSYIDILVEDGGDICTVDEVWCQWGYYLDEGQFYGWYDTFPIQFPEETRHDLVIECYDALGNKMVDEETFIVDKTPPETTKTYVGPQYPDPIDQEPYPHWITSTTEISLSATDSIGPHDSGVYETKYRVTLLGSNEACESDGRCQEIQTDGGAWTPYTIPFTIGEPSCHLIEYYSVDNVEKTEVTKRQCVYVENTAPTILEKQVGTPKVEKEGKIYISGLTPITMRCEDQGDHPVNHVSLWYRYRISDDCETWGEWLTDGCEGDVVDGWCDPNGQIVEKTIYFPEDSCHELEYYCVDALGHETTHEFEIDVVDNKPPEITKSLVGPWSGDCLPQDEEDECYIDGETVIHVEVTDPQPHPVNEVLCDWWYYLDNNNGPDGGDQDLTPPFDISFPEETEHELHIECCDALDNCYEDVEVFLVDKTPPEINKEYGRPFYDEEICMEWEEGQCIGHFGYCPKICVDWETVEWISGDTEITITVEDAGPHKTEIKETKYRYDIVDDDYCWGLLDCEEATTDKGWTIMSDPMYEEFYITEESCHLIEIMSTDNVEKTSTHKQCVFVDNTGPDTVKTVGEPKDMWTPGVDGDPESYFYPEETANCWATEDGIECWEATTLTPIVMDCDDSWDGEDTHPVGEKKICYKVDVDGEDETKKYCREYGGWYNRRSGYCCRWLGPEDENENHDDCEFFGYKDKCDEEIQGIECYNNRKLFYFLEETEHNLKYYCIDKLWNKGPEDEEKFKIEGNRFEIPLFKKWNLVSVPFTLLNDDPEVIFDKIYFDGELVNDTSDYIDSVWTYDPDPMHPICGLDWCVWTPGEEAPDNLRILPGWGYWVMVSDKPEEEWCGFRPKCFWHKHSEEPLWMIIGGSLFSPVTTPPSRELQKGWNLIGYYGTKWEEYDEGDFDFMCGDEYGGWWKHGIPEKKLYGEQVYCALNSLVDTQEGYPRWSSLWSYVNCGNHETDWLGLNACIDSSPFKAQDRMYAGRGYWLEIDVPDIYAPATNCIWNDDFECVWTGGGFPK